MVKIQDAYIINGGQPLAGEIKINTAKNSALFLMLAALLTKEEVILRDLPKLTDIMLMADMLEHFGAKVKWHERDLYIKAEKLTSTKAPYHLVGKMRASFVAIGPLLGRCDESTMPMPGGCAWGPRPIDRHIKAFADLGVEIIEEAGDFMFKKQGPLDGIVEFEAPTVGGTENVILAAALGEGKVIIENAALEPEIVDLVDMLNAMGAKITGAGTRTIVIDSAKELHGVDFRPIPDRIEAGTLMLAVAATRGKVVFKAVNFEHLDSVIKKCYEAGIKIEKLDDSSFELDATGKLYPLDIVTKEYPGIATDLQAPFGAFLVTVEGTSTVEETVYPLHRFKHVADLERMGAELSLKESTLTINGGKLIAEQLHAIDIRAGGALIIAALAAKGTSTVTGVEFIERGYEEIDRRLRELGADIHKSEIAKSITGTDGLSKLSIPPIS